MLITTQMPDNAYGLFLLLHTSEKGNGKGLPFLLAFKSCQYYMGNLNTMFINKFHEKEPPIVFHKEHWSKTLGVILGMKTVYWGKQNIKLVNPNQQAGMWRIIILVTIYMYWTELLLWWFYASYAYHIYIYLSW